MRRTYINFLLLIIAIGAQAQVNQQYHQYIQHRDSLMRMDSLAYFDEHVSLNQQEKLLNVKLCEVRDSMLAHYKASHFFPPARNFYASKSHIEGTKLFELIRQMPKGAMHHLHMSAMGDARWVVNRAMQTPEMYVYWGKNRDLKGKMHAYASGQAPEDYYPIQKLAKQIPAFPDSLHALLTFDQSLDADSVDIWREFENIFTRIYHFVGYAPIYEDYIVNALEILVEDGIQHVELRMIFGDRLYDIRSDFKKAEFEDYLSILESAQNRVRTIDPEFTLTTIYTNLRFREHPAIWKDMQRAAKLRQQFPYWIRGYDLVAEEDNGFPTFYHANAFLKLDSLEKAMDIDLPLYLHDGESDWASVANMYDAILLGSKRIGHGFNLFRFPNLMKLAKEKDICIEVNPLSNQVLGYIRDLRIHPASTYLRNDIQISISSDDPLIFDYKGLSYDYWSVFMAWELDLAALKQLSRNGLTYSTLQGEEKAKALEVWEARWKRFVEKALENYGD